MKLYYANKTRSYVPFANFGDDLNGWLWPQLLPGVFNDSTSEAAFVGFGTLLNENLPKFKQTIIFGTGHGFGNLPQIDDTWTIYCVRGPLTASALNIPPELGIADTAILVNRVYRPTDTKKKYKLAFIPYAWEMESSPEIFLEVCRQLDYICIDPRWEVEKVLQEISKSELVVSAAMHGAIVADALRVPWISLKSNAGIPDFKWTDFCQSLNLEYKVNRFYRFNSISEKIPGLKFLEIKRMVSYIRQLVHKSQFQLSKDHVMENKLDQLDEKLDLFKQDLKAGKFK
ncbi:polysaccharide pyruvyl transferase family protein [Trichormus sp. NMC-1]|uniref:polysaccharide pyruvyl transferase family protein n=1 Tax=Trichormus sp. NMC-1 TaxID=1853259 RepID=UPI0008DBF39A|nr:polysaccharide pyruvyl transferase family protein [Trichormus sp. NMC-1]